MTSAVDARRTLGEELLANLSHIMTRVMERGRKEVAAYAPYSVDVLMESAEPTWRWAITSVFLEAREPLPEELELFERAIEVRAKQGISFEALVVATRQLERELWAEVFPIAERFQIENEILLDTLGSLNNLYSTLIARAAQAYRRIEQEAARQDEQRRTQFLQLVLFGSLEPGALARQASDRGFSPLAEYVAFRARAETEDQLRVMERALVSQFAGSGPAPLIGLVERDLAGILPRRPQDVDVNGSVGVGPRGAIPSLAASFRLATRALEAAWAIGLSGIHGLEQLGLRAAVVSDDDLSSILVRRYIKPTHEAGDFGRVLLETLEALFRNGMRIDATARDLVIHPNTLRHRVQRFEGITGADLGSTEQLIEVWWALERYRMNQSYRHILSPDAPVDG